MSPTPNRVDLSRFTPGDYDPGRPFWFRGLWFIINALFLQNPLNASGKIKIALLRAFGAVIGQGVVMKPGLNIKSPWLLEIGDHSWIGEAVWLDNLVPISIGNHVCVSQGAYFCTGNHDWSDPAFSYKLGEIHVEDGAWIGARATLLPGVRVASHAVVSAGAVLSQDALPYTVYTGNPAVETRKRTIQSAEL